MNRLYYVFLTFINVLKQNVVTKDNLLSHAEISAKWHETNNTDPVTYFCKYEKTVDNFREDVQGRINIYLNIFLAVET